MYRKKKIRYTDSNDCECITLIFLLLFVFLYLISSPKIQIEPRLFIRASLPYSDLSVSNFDCLDANQVKHIGYNISFPYKERFKNEMTYWGDQNNPLPNSVSLTPLLRTNNRYKYCKWENKKRITLIPDTILENMFVKFIFPDADIYKLKLNFWN